MNPNMQTLLEKLKYNKAQTAIELAVFGSILIFIIGLIVKQGLNYSYMQNQSLKAMRWALSLSHLHSEGQMSGYPNPGGWGDASRNSASLLVIEDRLDADAGKYGAIDRIPLMNLGQGTHSRNLFMPIDPGEDYQMPVIDMFINGKHFPMSTAKLKTINTATVPAGCKPYVAIPNHPAFMDRWNSNCDACFNLDHNVATGGASGSDVPAPDYGGSLTPRQYRDQFAWQWMQIEWWEIEPETGQYTSADVDHCLPGGEAGLETIIGKSGNTLTVMDPDDGDLDFSPAIDPYRMFEPDPPGIQKDVRINTLVRQTPETGGVDGTYLRVEEKLHSDRPYYRTTQKKDATDIITRIIVLSNNTERFCASDGTRVTETSGHYHSFLWAANRQNPVEVCATGVGSDHCFSPANAARTCMDVSTNRIFVRSRILDLHGRRWATPVGSDDYINFIVPRSRP